MPGALGEAPALDPTSARRKRGASLGGFALMFKIPVSAWIPKAPAITDEDWSKLAAAGGVSISPYGQDQITRAIVEYYRDYALAGVRLKEVVPLLKEVAETGGRLERA